MTNTYQSAFFVKQKMPDSYSDLFFLQTTDIRLQGPLFTETTKLLDRPRPVSGNASSAKEFPFHFFFFNETYKTEQN